MDMLCTIPLEMASEPDSIDDSSFGGKSIWTDISWVLPGILLFSESGAYIIEGLNIRS